MGVASLVLGIISILVSWFPFAGVVMGALSTILGSKHIKQNTENRGIATGGLVCGLVGLSIGVLFTFALGCASCMATH